MDSTAVKSERLLQIYSRLVSGDTLPKKELAQQFHVTERSIQRDMESLRCFFAEQGLRQDIIYDRGERGYLCKVNLSILSSKGSEEKIDGNAADEIEEHFGDRFCLEDDGDQLLDIILESYRGSQITIEFVGTNENFQFFYKLCSKRQISLEKSSNQRILSCDEISRKITDKVMQLKSLGYDIDCNGEIDKILDATIPVVVVGNMSAGKSTFLNALIGEELLPSGQNRTTGVNCALHNSPKEVRVEYCAKGKMVSLDCVNLSASKNQALIPGELFSIIENEPKPINRVRCVIDYFNYKDDSIHLDSPTP